PSDKPGGSGRQRFQTELGGASHQLYARMHAELVQNVRNVVDGGLFGHDKLLGDLPVAQTATHEAYNLALTRRERAARWNLLAPTLSGVVDQLAKKVQCVLHSDVESYGTARLKRPVKAEFSESQPGATQVALIRIAVRWPKP